MNLPPLVGMTDPAGRTYQDLVRLIRRHLPLVRAPLLVGPIRHPDVIPPIFTLGPLRILASVDPAMDGTWYHVSFSLPDRIPSYEDMLAVRRTMFRPDVTVLQIFPPADQHVNEHPFTLHLWQYLDAEPPFRREARNP